MSGKTGQGTITGFESVYPNSLVSILNNKQFQSFSGLIGESAFKYLLLNTSLFMQMENGCLIQLSGKPLGSMKSRNALENEQCPNRNLDNTIIQWPRFLYGKPVYSEKGTIIASLMPERNSY